MFHLLNSLHALSMTYFAWTLPLPLGSIIMFPYPRFPDDGTPFIVWITSHLVPCELHKSALVIYFLAIFVLLILVKSLAWPSWRIRPERVRYNTIPYTLPFIGNSIAFITDCSRFLGDARQVQSFPHNYHTRVPQAIKLLR